MNVRNKFILALLAQLTIFVPTSEAQTFRSGSFSESITDTEQRRKFATQEIDIVREKLESSGQPAISALNSSIDVEIRLDQTGSPSADIFSNKITIPDSFLLANIFKSALLAAVNRDDLNEFDCTSKYFEHIRKNSEIAPPNVFTSANFDLCGPVSMRFPLGFIQTHQVKNEFAATLRFAFLHELGHFYHSHGFIQNLFGTRSAKGQCELAEIFVLYREMEYEADQFALKQLFELGLHREFLLIDAFWLGSGNDVSDLPVFSEFRHPDKLYRQNRLLRTYIELAESRGEVSDDLRKRAIETQRIEDELRALQAGLNLPDPCATD